MAILEYIPPKRDIVDRRDTGRGYYKAKCDVCGGEYFPARKNSRYCSAVCRTYAYRKSIAEKRENAKPNIEEVKKQAEAQRVRLQEAKKNDDLDLITKAKGYKQLLDVLSALDAPIKGKKGVIRGIKVGHSLKLGDVVIKRDTLISFLVYK